MSNGFQFSDRRNFIKKSLAVSVAASQPVFLAGLIRANGGGSSPPNKYGSDTTDPYITFSCTTDPYNPDPYPYTSDTTEYGSGSYYYY